MPQPKERGHSCPPGRLRPRGGQECPRSDLSAFEARHEYRGREVQLSSLNAAVLSFSRMEIGLFETWTAGTAPGDAAATIRPSSE